MRESLLEAYYIGIPIFFVITVVCTCCRATLKVKKNVYGACMLPLWLFTCVLFSVVWPAILVAVYVATLEWSKEFIRAAEG